MADEPTRRRRLSLRCLVASAIFVLGASNASEAIAADPDRVQWSVTWPRVRLWEVIAAAGLTIGDTLVEDYVPLPTKASFRGGLLFDDWARDVFRGRTAFAQSTASTVSDILFKAGSLVPFLIDDYFGAASIHREGDVAAQLFVIDLEALGFSGIVSLAAEHSVGRARPYTVDCDEKGQVRDASGQLLHHCVPGNDFRSFFSGHAAATSTVAGLVCLHHQHLPLFGGGLADLAPCLAMIGVSAATGILRLVYDHHWASDVIVGWADGALSGYVLPSLLHFGFGNHPAIGAIHGQGLAMVPTLRPYPGGAAIELSAVF